MTLVAAVVAMVVLCGCGAPSLGALAAALVLGGAAVGELRLQSIDRSAALIEDGRVVDVSAHLLTPPRPSAFGSSAEVGVIGGHLDSARLLVRVPRWERLPERVRVGDELRLRGRLRALDHGPSQGRAPAGRATAGRARVGRWRSRTTGEWARRRGAPRRRIRDQRGHRDRRRLLRLRRLPAPARHRGRAPPRRCRRHRPATRRHRARPRSDA